MKKKIRQCCLFLLLCFSCLGSLHAQAPLVKNWDARFGGFGHDKLSSLLQTKDGGYFLAGHSLSSSSGDRTESTRGMDDYWVIKIDSVGNKQWDKSFGGYRSDYLFSSAATNDGGYILGGSSMSGISGDKTDAVFGSYTYDYWIVKIDSAGQKQWDQCYGGTYGDDLLSLKQTRDGGYILGGASMSPADGDKSEPYWNGVDISDYWVVKIDSVGNKEWDKRFGGTNRDILYSLEQTTDNGYILGGESKSRADGNVTEPGRGEEDYWIVKIDSAGNKQWDKRFGGLRADLLSCLHQTRDGGYILGGISQSGNEGDKTEPMGDTATLNSQLGADYWIVKIDSAGNKIWDKKYGGLNVEEKLGSLTQTSDGGYLLAGSSFSNASGDKTENNLGLEQTWIVKTDLNGVKQWDKTIFTFSEYEFVEGYALETREGGYLIANSTCAGINGYKTQANRDTSNRTSDYWIIKFTDTSHICLTGITTISSDPASICSNDSVAISGRPGYSNYLWNNGMTSSSIKTNYPGAYQLTITDANGCTAASGQMTINSYSKPSVSVSVSRDTLKVYDAENCQWYLNDTLIQGATSTFYIPEQAGVYLVEVIDTNGCSAFSNEIVISGIGDLNDNSKITLYPNPTSEKLYCRIKNGSNLSAKILTVQGMVVISDFVVTRPNFDIDVSTLPSGIYFLQLSDERQRVVRKFVK